MSDLNNQNGPSSYQQGGQMPPGQQPYPQGQPMYQQGGQAPQGQQPYPQGQPMYQQGGQPPYQQGHPQNRPSQKKSNAGLIIGIVVGVVLVFFVLIILAIIPAYRRYKAKVESNSTTESADFGSDDLDYDLSDEIDKLNEDIDKLNEDLDITEFKFEDATEDAGSSDTLCDDTAEAAEVTESTSDVVTGEVTEASDSQEATTESSSDIPEFETSAAIDKNYFISNKWVEKNSNSYLVPEEGDTFKYYKDKADTSDYYYEGPVEFYSGKEAYEFVTANSEMIKYGVTKEELDGLFERNEEYSMDNFVCMVLHNEKCIIGGENTITDFVVTPYYGFYLTNGSDEILQVVNMNSPEYYDFVLDK